ncbi:MAG: gliding motility-associated C-terminal domain-containing protein [Bacteroidota bacterium]
MNWVPRFLICLLLSIPFTSTAADYFWIGGSGDWSDISHWATTSGGAITHSQAPTADDDVYFDGNSFTAPGQTVTMNTDIIFCRSMNWMAATNNPTFVGGANVTLNVFGSLDMIANMTFNFSGEVVFTGNLLDNTVNFGPHTAGQDVLFSGNGAWTLNGGITVDSAFVFNEGELYTNGQAVDCLYFYSNSTSLRTLDLGNSTITIRGQTIDPFDGNIPDQIIQPLRIHAQNLNMTPGTSTFVLTNPIVDIWMEGPGTVNFNRVFLSSPIGNSRIIPWLPFGDIANTPTMNYNELELAHLTLLNGSPTIGNLILYPDQRYLFEGGQTFTYDNIDAVGDCLQNVAIESTDGGTPVDFSTANAITVDYVSLRGVNAVGTGSFTANNAVDLGGNANWIINPRISQDFYWVGGTGNWSDPVHWSFTSGGPSSGCIPSQIDDVFFDANSFNGGGQTVNIDVENAYCRSMDWTGATNMPGLTGPGQNALRLGGSLTFIADMQNNFDGAFFFESDLMGNTITTAGQPFNFDLNFSGVNGEWIFLDNVFVGQNIYFTSGTLRTNGHDIDANRFYSEFPFQRQLFLGTSYIQLNLRNNRAPIWEMQTDNINMDAGESTIEFTGSFSTLFRNEGNNTAAYNNVIFNAFEGRYFNLINFPGTDITVDSLTFLQEGFISGNSTVNYWYMAPGHNYEFVSSVRQTITELDANGNCEDGMIYIRTTSLGYATQLEINNDHTFERLFLHGIEQIGTGNLQANNSVDDGGNVNWDFNPFAARTLYWVGNSGEWTDQIHWSLSSGGPGGECIPTPQDDVIFDANSFADANPFVFNSLGSHMYCRDMRWEAGVANMPQYNANYLDIFGSLTIEAAMTWNLTFASFLGSGDHTITTSGVPLFTVRFNGTGTFTLQDFLEANSIRFDRGTFDTNNQNIRALDMGAHSLANTKSLILNDSYIELIGPNPNPFLATFSIISDGMTIDPGNSILELSHPQSGVEFSYSLDLNNVIFSAPDGDVYVDTENGFFNLLSFSGSAEMIGRNTTDTMFCAPGKNYIFESSRTQTINEYWQIIGNNCTPIGLSASNIGSWANVNMPATGNILADFIQMRDIRALGDAEFLAGARSTDIANSNIGWIFDSAPEFIDVGFLGPDVALCNGEPVTLDAYSFSIGETYLWQDGSTDSTLVVDQSGTYSVEVTFLSNCVIRDTIDVVAAQDFAVDLADDPILCEGESLTLEPGITISSAIYTWQDGSSDPTFEASTAGEYFVEVSIGGCTDADTTMVSVTAFPTLDLGADLMLCEGENFTLNSGTMANSYLWQDGSSMPDFSGDAPGTYWLEAANDICAVRDSVEVSYTALPVFALGEDTLLCDEPSIQLSLPASDISYTWSDGSMGNSLVANATGLYWVEGSRMGCTARDSINLTFQDNPEIEFGDEIFGCNGDIISLSSPVMADSYEWSDGDTDPDFSTTMAGTYFLDATFGQCVVREFFEVILSDYPTINPLGADTSICEGSTLTLSADTDLGMISWQDGSLGNSFQVTSAGEYSYQADNMGCITADTIAVLVLDLPDLDLDDNYTECDGETFILTTMVNADSYSWSNGDMGPSFSSMTAGNYTLTATIGECTLEGNFDLAFVAPPTVDLGADQTACTGDIIVLNAGQDGTWQDGSFSTVFSVTSSGLYIVEVSEGNCATRDSIQIDYLDSPVFSLGANETACEGESLTLTAPINLGTWTWEDGSMDTTRLFNTSGLYWLEVTAANGCSTRDSVAYTFAPLPILDLGMDTTVCDNLAFQLKPERGTGDLVWFDGSTSDVYPVDTPGLISASLNNQGCIASDTVLVQFKECTVFQAFIPNVFSPNEDGLNDSFFPQFDDSIEILEYELQVFDRWGNQLFTSQNVSEGWRGRSRGDLLPQGVYVFFIDITYQDDLGINSEVLSGDITLIR